jgi:hypothetical protein
VASQHRRHYRTATKARLSWASSRCPRQTTGSQATASMVRRQAMRQQGMRDSLLSASLLAQTANQWAQLVLEGNQGLPTTLWWGDAAYMGHLRNGEGP